LDRAFQVLINTLFVSVLLGIVPAIIAYGKGRSVVGWWLFGLASCFLVGLGAIVFPIVLAYLWEPNRAELDRRAWLAGQMRLCPYCAELLKPQAVFCRYCQHDVAGLQSAFLADEKTVDAVKVCPYCATGIRQGANFCRFCNHALELKPESPSTEEGLVLQSLAVEFARKYGYVYQPGLPAFPDLLRVMEKELATRLAKVADSSQPDSAIEDLRALLKQFREQLVKAGQLPAPQQTPQPDSRVFVLGRD
jgi:hypothetical protein